jgi:hypothetical protein
MVDMERFGAECHSRWQKRHYIRKKAALAAWSPLLEDIECLLEESVLMMSTNRTWLDTESEF